MMENKEVEKSLSNIREGVFCDEDTDSIKEYIEQLEQEICSALGVIGHVCSIVVERGKDAKQLEEQNKDLRERLIRMRRWGV